MRGILDLFERNYISLWNINYCFPRIDDLLSNHRPRTLWYLNNPNFVNYSSYSFVVINQWLDGWWSHIVCWLFQNFLKALFQIFWNFLTIQKFMNHFFECKVNSFVLFNQIYHQSDAIGADCIWLIEKLWQWIYCLLILAL